MAKILVADDNSNIQKMVGLALKDQGIDVVAVGNGEAAVRKLADVKPDLVLADVFMPVRNGYEVCRYVKEDPAYAHIPVILLVGAFDPLDEQEAQRVGADGVLKKPFVPPDPLISMVKSALARAGVQIGPPAHEKEPEPAKRNASEILSSCVGSKLAALTSPTLSEPEPELEEFPTTPRGVTIDAGQEPVAFGSLLETPETEEDAAFVTRPVSGVVEERSWGSDEEVEEEEEIEEDSPRGGWRPGGLEEAAEPVAQTPDRASDWREAAFHGHSPANGSGSRAGAPAVAEPHVEEVAEAHAVVVSTMEAKPADAPAPFSGDAWPAAMAAGVEEKTAEVHETVAPEVVAQATVTQETHPEAVKAAEDANNWYSGSSTPWDLEAKKASLLAATWDAPVAQESPVVEEAHAPEIQAAITEQIQEAVQEVVHEEAAPFVSKPERSPNETQEIEAYESPESKGWTNPWAVPPAEAHGDSPETVEAPAPHSEEPAPLVKEPPPVDEPAPVLQPEYAAAPAIEEHHSEPEAALPNMDELVARVLQKINPDVLHKVTQEILRPVIEAIVKDELNSKK